MKRVFAKTRSRVARLAKMAFQCGESACTPPVKVTQKPVTCYSDLSKTNVHMSDVLFASEKSCKHT